MNIITHQTQNSFWEVGVILNTLWVQDTNFQVNASSPVGFFHRFITVRPTVFRCWHVWEIR